MAVISKDLGAVTAYAAAVNRGYTGTREEFETLMASYAYVGEQAAKSASNASQSATDASQSATDAETAKGTAQQAATDAQTAQASAQGYARSAQQSAQSASQSAQNAESAKNTAVNAVDGFAAGAQQALDSVNQAGNNWKSLAQGHALDSEAWAVGKRGGEDVGSSDPAYNNNAKWYALTAATDATTASDAAQTATTKAREAQASASAAAESARTLKIDATLTQSGQAADSKVVGDKINEKVDKSGTGQILPQNIHGVTVSGGNILDDAERLYSTQRGGTTTDGYVNLSDGTAIIQNAAYYCSFLVPIKPNTHYTSNNLIRFAVLLKDISTSGTSPVEYSTVVGSALANITSFDTGEADHIIVSWNYNSFPIDSFIISEGDTPTTEQTIVLPDWLKGHDYSTEIEDLDTRVSALENSEGEKPKFAKVSGDMSSGDSLVLPLVKNNLRKGERIVFEGKITSFSSLKIGQTYTARVTDSTERNNIFLIDGTNISYYVTGTATPVIVPHGLTIANNIQFIWEMSSVATCKITLISGGNMFSHEFNSFVRKTVGFPFVLSVDTVLTDCKLTWTCTDLCKDIWMFGDSYFAYSEDRWTYYLHQYGYDNNCLLDGFPGEGGVNGRVAFNNLLQFGTPKIAMWCLGMNDGSDSNTAPSADWVSTRNYFLLYCTQNNITPIFGTIPTVPSINHEQKNAWIRSSGYRYIDFAKAVGAQSDGTWFSGMLSPDNVHPTEKGARALFARVLLDLPEIMIN